MRKPAKIFFVVLVIVILIISLSAIVYFSSANGQKAKRRLVGLVNDTNIRLKTPKERQEIERLRSTPVEFVGAERYGSENLEMEDSSDEQDSFFVGGTIVDKGDNWVVLDTLTKKVKFVKGEDPTCFLEIPVFGPEIEGETVSCNSENIPLGGYGLVTAEIKPGDKYAQYSYFLFVKPEDLQVKP